MEQVSPLRPEAYDFTCLTRKRSWTGLFQTFGEEIKKNRDLRTKIDFETFDCHGWNGIHAAVIINDIDLVKILIDIGVRIDVASRSGWTIFHYASRSPAMLQLLLDLLGPRDVSIAEIDSGYDSETPSLS